MNNVAQNSDEIIFVDRQQEDDLQMQIKRLRKKNQQLKNKKQRKQAKLKLAERAVL